jgi:hypothetical protein
MPVKYYIQRGFTYKACKWDGTNFAEVEAYVATYGNTVTLNPDTTISYNGQDFPVGTISFNGANFVHTDVDVAANYQQVNVAPPWDWQFTQDVKARQAKVMSVPALILGAKQTLTVVWDTPMPSASYDVTITPQSAATVIGNVAYTLVAGSKTATQCQVAVSGILAVTVGTTTLEVVARQA